MPVIISTDMSTEMCLVLPYSKETGENVGFEFLVGILPVLLCLITSALFELRLIVHFNMDFTLQCKIDRTVEEVSLDILLFLHIANIFALPL